MGTSEPLPSLAQRSTRKLIFDQQDMDYYYSWILGRADYEGSDPSECHDIAARISDGDVTSWQREWAQEAEKVESQAQAALEAGDRETARRAFLRACSYYRAPTMIMARQDPAFPTLWKKMHECFREASPLFNPPVEVVSVHYRGRRLDGYFWPVDSSGSPRPTLLLVGGMETFAEDCYFVVGSAARERGYNVLTVDLPGQGVNPDQGLYLEARMEVPMRVVVDYALSRPEVAPGKLVTYGFSWGGHIVLKGAADDSRLSAVIANPPMPDVFRAAWAQQGGQRKNDPIARILFDQIAWRFGLKISPRPPDLVGRLVKAYQYLTQGKADLNRITYPTLLLAGEGEARITLEIARESMRKLSNPKSRLIIFTRDQGSEAHCQIDKPSLPNRAIFDWLESAV